MKRIFLINTRLVTILLFVSFLFQQNLKAQVSKLKVIPEVQQFTASSGTTSMSRKVKILVETVHSDSLMPIALQLKDELKTMMNITASIAETNSTTSKKNEVLLMYSKTRHIKVKGNADINHVIRVDFYLHNGKDSLVKYVEEVNFKSLNSL